MLNGNFVAYGVEFGQHLGGLEGLTSGLESIDVSVIEHSTLILHTLDLNPGHYKI